MSSRKRASLSNNSPLDQLFTPSTDEVEREAPARETPAPHESGARAGRGGGERPYETRPTGEQPFVRPTSPHAPSTPEAERELRQTTIMIYGDQADWLDEACYLARRESGSNISKAAILRALVDMAREDESVRARLRERLGVG